MKPRLGACLFVIAAVLSAGAFSAACSPSDDGLGIDYAPRRTRGPEAEAGDDDGAAPAPTSTTPSCSNGVRDGAETDVDCGGGTCPPCANGRACSISSDCVSLVCSGGVCMNDVGCSDGTREGFASLDMFPDIAACAGGWSVPGLGASPACGRKSGNGSTNPTGKDCSAADLCQVGWHVCESPAAVAERTGGQGCAAAGVAGQNAFFAIRQAGPGDAQCGVGNNDLFGCGDVGATPDATTCAPLDRFSNDLCVALPDTWQCGDVGTEELNNVTKAASEGGGVLCCRDR